MFEAGSNGEPWQEKPEMKKVVEEIEKKKNFEKITFMKNTEIKMTRLESERMMARLAILKSANDNSRPTNTQLEEKLENIKSEILIEKELLAQANIEIESRKLLNPKTNLYFNSIAQKLGIPEIKNELKVLSEKKILVEIVEKMKDVVHDISTKVTEEELGLLGKGDNLVYGRILKRMT